MAYLLYTCILSHAYHLCILKQGKKYLLLKPNKNNQMVKLNNLCGNKLNQFETILLIGTAKFIKTIYCNCELLQGFVKKFALEFHKT